MTSVEAAARNPKTKNYQGKPPRSSWLLAALALGCLTASYLTAGGLVARAQTAGDEKQAPASAQNPAAKPLELQLKPVDLKSLPRNLVCRSKELLDYSISHDHGGVAVDRAIGFCRSRDVGK